MSFQGHKDPWRQGLLSSLPRKESMASQKAQLSWPRLGKGRLAPYTAMPPTLTFPPPSSVEILLHDLPLSSRPPKTQVHVLWLVYKSILGLDSWARRWVVFGESFRGCGVRNPSHPLTELGCVPVICAQVWRMSHACGFLCVQVCVALWDTQE